MGKDGDGGKDADGGEGKGALEVGEMDTCMASLVVVEMGSGKVWAVGTPVVEESGSST